MKWKSPKNKCLYIGRGLEYGSWRMRIGRFFIGFWLQSEVGWNWWRESYDNTCKYVAFGIGEVRWYHK